MSPDQPPPRLGFGMWKRFVLAGVLIVVMSAAATATAGLLKVRGYAAALNLGGKRVECAVCTPAQAGAAQTILLLGSDSRVADRRRGIKGNSDTMILVRLDPDAKFNTVLSVPRDLKVTIRLPDGNNETAKINAAYPLGGPRLTVKTIREVLGIKINHVVNINFRGFKEAVNRVGCVYADIDRRYFNDNAIAYATIDQQPGYQKMCGSKALDYVRFRHEDTDLVRSARQQDFLRQAKDQVAVKKIVADSEQFASIFGRYTETDIRGTSQILRLFKLVAFSAAHPIREVHFQTELGPSFVTSTRAQLRATASEFLHPSARAKAARRAPIRRRVGLATNIENAKQDGESQAIEAATGVRFPVLYPRVRLAGSQYVDKPRTYVIQDLRGRRHTAYRMVVRKSSLGEYYGIQGMTWQDPPLLENPSEKRTIAGRRYELFYDGSHLRLVALRTPRAVYWVSNTLLLSVSNAQMLAIARSLQPIR